MTRKQLVKAVISSLDKKQLYVDEEQGVVTDKYILYHGELAQEIVKGLGKYMVNELPASYKERLRSLTGEPSGMHVDLDLKYTLPVNMHKRERDVYSVVYHGCDRSLYVAINKKYRKLIQDYYSHIINIGGLGESGRIVDTPLCLADSVSGKILIMPMQLDQDTELYL